MLCWQRFPGKTDYKRATKELLQELQTLGYRMSAKKSEATYLGYKLRGGYLFHSRVATILQIPTPKTKTQVGLSLDVARYCCL